jgi:hypothetical protein
MDFNVLRKDRLVVGIVLGLLLPLLVIYIQYQMKYSNWTFSQFVNLLKQEKKLLTGVTTIGLVVNGLLFGILIQFKKYETGRGIFIPTVIYGIAVLVYKLL